MTAFDYAQSRDPIRDDLAASYRRTWERIASAGTWLTGVQRVAVAAETRKARECTLCLERSQALSPHGVKGEHDHAGVLSTALVDAIHRITTDATRLSQSWYQALLEQGVSPEEYVEAVGVAVCTISIDAFDDAMGIVRQALPEPREGTPSRERPNDVVEGEAWVPMRSAKGLSADLDLPAGRAPYVLRALSLVGAEVRAWDDLSRNQYLAKSDMMSFKKKRAIDRSQIELLAGRVSALNECFY